MQFVLTSGLGNGLARLDFSQDLSLGSCHSCYWCGSRSKSRDFPGERPCRPDLYPIAVVEQAALKSVQEAWERPDAIAAALAVYQQAERQAPAADPCRELAALDKALAQVKAEEAAAVQAQIAGIMRGMSPDAYTEAFAGIAARRKDMEDRRDVLAASSMSFLSRSQGQKTGGRNAPKLLIDCALEDAWTMLTDENVTGPEKRILLGTIVDKVIPHKEGADVFFAPRVLRDAEGEEEPDSERSRHTFHTTCIGMRTQR